MPKVTVSRRRARSLQNQSPASSQQDQCLLLETSHMSLNRTSPRKVSEEDINSCTVQNTYSSDEEPPQLRRMPQLKRPLQSVCLVDLLGTRDESNAPLCTSPGSSFDGSEDPCLVSPSSPWGHFVDLLVPSTVEEQEEAARAVSPRSFLPSACATVQPYTKAKRRRIYSPSRPTTLQGSGQESSEFEGFLLASPNSMLDAAQTALESFSF